MLFCTSGTRDRYRISDAKRFLRIEMHDPSTGVSNTQVSRKTLVPSGYAMVWIKDQNRIPFMAYLHI